MGIIMSINLEEIALRVKHIREAIGQTQTEFANRLGIGRTSLSAIENAKTSPTFEFIIGLYHINVNIHYLLDGKGPIFCNTAPFVFINDDDRKFFEYYEQSQIVRLDAQLRFNILLEEKGEIIHREIERKKNK